MRVKEWKNIGQMTINCKNKITNRCIASFGFVDRDKKINSDNYKRKPNFYFSTNKNGAKMSTSSKIQKNTIPVAPTTQWIPGILGSLISLLVSDYAIKLHEYVDKNHKNLGPIYRVGFGSTGFIFLNSPNEFRNVFRLEGPTPMHFLPEPWHFYNKLRNCPRGLLFMDGEEWLHFRRILNKVLLIPNPGNIMVPRCYEAANDLVEEWKSFADTPQTIPELENRLYRWSIEVMLATLVGSSWKNYKPQVEEDIRKLSTILHRIFSLTAKLSMIPTKYAIKFRLPIWKNFCQVSDEALSTVNSIVPKIIRLEGDGLLSLMIKEGITSEKDLIRIVTDLIIAAGDTTAYSTQWSLLMLAKYPRVQEKLYERINGLDEKEITSDNYVKAIVKESLRLYPTAPFLTRYLPNDAMIAGHLVCKEELIIMSMYSAGRDPKNFPEPDEFLPERWMRNEAGNYEKVTNPYGSLPFALGARSCVGRKLAETQIQLTISQIVKNFKIECPNAESIKMILHLIGVPSAPIKLKLKKR